MESLLYLIGFGSVLLVTWAMYYFIKIVDPFH